MPLPFAAPRPLTTPAVVVMLTLLLGIQPVTTDLYLPALPTLQRDLGASIGAAQFTLTALIIAFGLGQLVCGPLADRFGRRPVLLVGLSLYTLAGLASAASASIEALIAWRTLQGAAMAAAVTCGRSIVRDLFEPAAGARTMSRALSGLGMIAVLSPLVGGVVVEAFGWHATLLVLAAFGAISLLDVALRLPETVPRRSYEPLVPGFFQVESPNLYRNPFTSDPEELSAICATLNCRASFTRWKHSVTIMACRFVQRRADRAPESKQHEAFASPAVRRGDAGILNRFLAWLGHTGAVEQHGEPAVKDPLQNVTQQFRHYLLQERGLSVATLPNYVTFIDQFLSERFRNRTLNLSTLRVADVTGFVQRHAHRLSPGRAKLLVTALRSFFRYLRHRGEISLDLAACVPIDSRCAVGNSL
jgi:multidrug resistance protein